MKIMIQINQQVKLLVPATLDEGIRMEKMIEYAGRNCYASRDKITDTSYKKFDSGLISRGHTSPVEFGDVIFELTTSRAVLAELTRHRLASFCVESQRYIQEAKTGDITFIIPEWFEHKEPCTCSSIDCNKYNEDENIVLSQLLKIEEEYKHLIEIGKKPEEAREILPNATACNIMFKCNFREMLHVINLRTSPAAYPQIRTLVGQMENLLQQNTSRIFNHE